MISDLRHKILKEYLKLFDIVAIESLSKEIDRICGIAVFSDNETQEFCWHTTKEKAPENDVLKLIETIRINGLNEGDKLKVTEEELFILLGWSDRSRFQKSIDELFSIEIKMIDEGNETDSFFLHG